VLLSLSAFGQSIAGPNIAALISHHADPAHQGQYLGLNNAAGALARLTGPFVAGLAFADIGVDAPFYISGLLTMPAIALALQAKRPAAP
jgi:MFS family permease